MMQKIVQIMNDLFHALRAQKKGVTRMEKLIVQATVPEKKAAEGNVTVAQIGPFQIELETGSTAAELVALYGDAAVKSNAISNWIVTLQSNMRSGMKKGESQEALQARLASAKMGVATQGVKIDPEQAYIAAFKSATPEKQKEMLAKLREQAGK
jgi:hypothetical protein